MCENLKISGTRWSGRVEKRSSLAFSVKRFPEKVEILENFENPATVSRTTLQCCVAAYKLCKYTVQFLLPVSVKLLETQILRIV